MQIHVSHKRVDWNQALECDLEDLERELQELIPAPDEPGAALWVRLKPSPEGVRCRLRLSVAGRTVAVDTGGEDASDALDAARARLLPAAGFLRRRPVPPPLSAMTTPPELQTAV